MKKVIQSRKRLCDFALIVLEILQGDSEWNADTIDRIGGEAIDRELGKVGPDGLFISTFNHKSI